MAQRTCERILRSKWLLLLDGLAGTAWAGTLALLLIGYSSRTRQPTSMDPGQTVPYISDAGVISQITFIIGTLSMVVLVSVTVVCERILAHWRRKVSADVLDQYFSSSVARPANRWESLLVSAQRSSRSCAWLRTLYLCPLVIGASIALLLVAAFSVEIYRNTHIICLATFLALSGLYAFSLLLHALGRSYTLWRLRKLGQPTEHIYGPYLSRPGERRRSIEWLMQPHCISAYRLFFAMMTGLCAGGWYLWKKNNPDLSAVLEWATGACFVELLWYHAVRLRIVQVELRRAMEFVPAEVKPGSSTPSTMSGSGADLLTPSTTTSDFNQEKVPTA